MLDSGTGTSKKPHADDSSSEKTEPLPGKFPYILYHLLYQILSCSSPMLNVKYYTGKISSPIKYTKHFKCNSSFLFSEKESPPKKICRYFASHVKIPDGKTRRKGRTKTSGKTANSLIEVLKKLAKNNFTGSII